MRGRWYHAITIDVHFLGCGTMDKIVVRLPKEEMVTLDCRDGLRHVGASVIFFYSIPSSPLYQAIRLSHGGTLELRMPTYGLWSLLQPHHAFFMCSQSAILNLGHVKMLGTKDALMSDGATIAVSRRSMPRLRKALLCFS